MEYAKNINGKIRTLPLGLFANSPFAQAPTPEQLLAAGWLPVDEGEKPEVQDGFIAQAKYVQTDSAIVKKWTVKRDMRPLSQSAVSKMLIAQQINSLVVDDNTALRMLEFYPEWAENTAYGVGYKVQRNGKMWRVLQAHTSIVTWEPENAASLWEQINETHAGTLDDPIPYDGNMALESRKYYTQNDVIYLCNRDTVNPVYNALAELVGLYVEIV